MTKFKIRLDEKKQTITFTSESRGVAVFEYIKHKFYTHPNNLKRYNSIKKYFIRISFYKDLFLKEEFEYETEIDKIKVNNYFNLIFSLTNSLYYQYNKYNIGNIFNDFVAKYNKFENKQGYKEKWDNERKEFIKLEYDKEKLNLNKCEYYDILSTKYKSNLYYIEIKDVIEYIFYLVNKFPFTINFNLKELMGIPKNFKIRKDILRILKEQKIPITRNFITEYEKYKNIVNDIILILDNEKLFEMVYHTRNNNFNYIIDRLNWINLLCQMNYNIKEILLNYFNYFGVYENLSFCEYVEYLTDYASMNNLMNVTKFKKYPKYLKSNHDIITNEYNNYKKVYSEEMFYNNINHSLEYKDTIYSIISPKNTTEVKMEGQNLSHCVGSYIDRIIQKQTQIFFMRLSKNITESLVTLEFRENTLIQAKGYSNRPVTKEERKFLEKFCKNKKLLLRI